QSTLVQGVLMSSGSRHLFKLSVMALAILSGCASGPSSTPRPSSPEGLVSTGTSTTAQTSNERFVQWLAGFRESARVAGIDEATLRAALDGVRPYHRAVVADRSQPEFTRAFWDYLEGVVSDRRV